jgi:hypothetical protein
MSSHNATAYCQSTSPATLRQGILLLLCERWARARLYFIPAARAQEPALDEDNTCAFDVHLLTVRRCFLALRGMAAQ